MPAEYLLKVCILGFPGELKTDWVRRYAEGKFTTDYLPTLGVDITTKQIHVNCNNVKLILVDTASQEFFGKLRPSYYRGASAAIITFDKGDRDSFKAVKKYYYEFKKYIPQVSIPITLVGFITKSEPKASTSFFLKIQKQLKKIRKWSDWFNNEEIYEEREITSDEGQSLAEELGASYYETQTTLGGNTIESIFYNLVLQVLRRKSPHGDHKELGGN